MEHEPIDPRIIEAMEACRVGRDDMSEPELVLLAAHLAAHPEWEEIYHRLQRVDSSLAKAFHDVPVPEGLADRILARLATNAPVAPAAPSAPRTSRRRWLVAAGLGIALASSLLVAFMLRGDRRVYSDTQVLETAIRLFETEKPSPDDWHLVAQAPTPKNYPVSPLVAQPPQMRWRELPNFLGRKGVAYDLTRPGGVRATLYVIGQHVIGVPSSPPSRPSLTTHNRSVAAWQSDSLLYVLVVDGGPRSYRTYLNLPHGPVAWSREDVGQGKWGVERGA